jgi:hypothetical protein
MTDERIVYQLRRLLLGLVVATFVGTIIELWLSDHTGEPKQLIPFALCALGLITALAVLIRPQRATSEMICSFVPSISGFSFMGAASHGRRHCELTCIKQFVVQFEPGIRKQFSKP